MRQWLILAWLLCLLVPRLLFEIVERMQHLVAPGMAGDAWLIGPLGSALLTLALQLLGVGWLIERAVLRPLEALRQAAHQIATGDINVSLPSSPVAEINQVA